MKLDAAYVNRIADATGFDALQLEKVIRLRQLLIEFRKHSFLRERLVLKGGTAVNLFYLDLARLSLDIDPSNVSLQSFLTSSNPRRIVLLGDARALMT
ncbi:MAG TPA: nucleotidyl transferase AbiEii/AbiGii toxin family protein [Candidatus Udaeobacter sp.]|nr:nucleotidyl transferase AbiEii/AbiGii toxin family protein [Candidatus Udaeobacter sp.]